MPTTYDGWLKTSIRGGCCATGDLRVSDLAAKAGLHREGMRTQGGAGPFWLPTQNRRWSRAGEAELEFMAELKSVSVTVGSSEPSERYSRLGVVGADARQES